MGNWTQEEHEKTKDIVEMERYTPKDLTNSKEFTRELHNIETNQTLSVLDKYRYKKQLMRAVYLAKQKEISHHLESFETYLLARKDVEGKSITLEAQKAIMVLEEEQLRMMKEMGLSHTEEISSTLIKAGHMLTEKLAEIEESEMRPEIKKMTFNNVRRVWEKTNRRILASVDSYMDELYEKEKNKHFS